MGKAKKYVPREESPDEELAKASPLLTMRNKEKPSLGRYIREKEVNKLSDGTYFPCRSKAI